MNYNRLNVKFDLKQLRGLKTMMEGISFRMNSFATKYYKLIHLIEKIDGKDKVPESLKGIEEKMGIIRNDLMGVMSIFFMDMDITVYGLTVCANSCEALCDRYESTVDDLLELYISKEKIVNKMQPLSQQSDSMQDIDDKITGNKSTDYKREAIKIIDLFNNFGITDEKKLKDFHSNNVELDEKGKECLKNLTTVIHNVSPTSVSAEDITKLKEKLDKLGRISMLDEISKNDEYDDIEAFTGDLAGREMRVTREEGEELADDNIDDKLDAMQILGLFNSERVTDEDLLKLVPVRKENLDEESQMYLKNIVEIINDISPSELLVEDAIKIKETVIALSEMNTLNDLARKNKFKDIDDFIGDLADKKGRIK